jgi:hypothetical protein
MLKRIGTTYDENLSLVEVFENEDGTYAIHKRGRLVLTLNPNEAFDLGILLTQHQHQRATEND